MVPWSDTPLPSSGSRGRRFATFAGTIRVFRLPAVPLARLTARSSGDTTPCCVVRKRGVAVCRLLIGTAPVPQSSSFARARGDEAGSPRFLGNPFANMLCSSTPADRMHRATTTHSVLPSVRLTTSAPRSVTSRGSITQPVRSLSTLRGSDYSDHTAQDSLPAGGQPWRGRT